MAETGRLDRRSVVVDFQAVHRTVVVGGSRSTVAKPKVIAGRFNTATVHALSMDAGSFERSFQQREEG